MSRIYHLVLNALGPKERDKAYECIERNWGPEPSYRSDLNGLLRRFLGISATEAAETIDDLVTRGLLIESEE